MGGIQAQQPGQGSFQYFFFRGIRKIRDYLGLGTQPGIGPFAVEKDLGLYIGGFQELGQGGYLVASGFVQVPDTLLVECIPPQPGADVIQDPFLGNFFQLDGTAFRHMGEPFLQFPGNGNCFPPHQSLEPAGEIVFPVGLGHKVQDGQAIFSLVQAKSPAQLLEEHCHTVGGP